MYRKLGPFPLGNGDELTEEAQHWQEQAAEQNYYIQGDVKPHDDSSSNKFLQRAKREARERRVKRGVMTYQDRVDMQREAALAEMSKQNEQQPIHSVLSSPKPATPQLRGSKAVLAAWDADYSNNSLDKPLVSLFETIRDAHAKFQIASKYFAQIEEKESKYASGIDLPDKIKRYIVDQRIQRSNRKV